MPSFYQGDLFRALTKTGDVDLHVVFTQRIPIDRLRLGWEDDLNGFRYEFLDDRFPIVHAVQRARQDRGRTHIVGGLWSGAVVESVLLTLMVLGAHYFIYSESPDPRIPLPLWKRTILTPLGKQIVSRANGILSISHFAENYFRSYGAEVSSIFPFGYFRSLPHPLARSTRTKIKKRIDLVFVGQLIQRKGVDLLLAASEPVLATHDNVFLQFIGTGKDEDKLRNWVSEKKLSHCVSFEGSLEPRKIIRRISEADLLVLPSRWDGWGMVINEALMASVPVMVSDMCGAADLIKDGVNGFIFKSEDADDLRTKLTHYVDNADCRRKMKKHAKKTGALLGSDSAARYLIGLLDQGKGNKQTFSENYPWIRPHRIDAGFE